MSATAEKTAPTAQEVDRAIDVIKADPNLATKKTVRRLVWDSNDEKKKKKEPRKPSEWPKWLSWIGELFGWIAETSQMLFWLLIALVIIWTVGRAVFEPGRITYHRVTGAILLYLTIGLVFVALYSLVGAVSPTAFNGLTVAARVSLPSDLVYLHRPASLEDVFLKLTGRDLRD
jgi:hypothetical protein